MQTAQIIDFDLTIIARRIRENFTGEQSDTELATTLAERKQARRKAIAEDLALVQANPPAEGFQAWVKTNCPFNVQSAYNYLAGIQKLDTAPDSTPDAPEQPKKRNKGGRPKGSAEPKTGPQTWLQAVVLHFGGYPAGFGHPALTDKKSKQRSAIEAECGFPVVPNDPSKYASICAAIQRLLDRAQPDAAAKRVDAEVKTLSETAQAKLERLVAAKINVETAALRASFYDQVVAEVDKRVPDQRAEYLADAEKAREELRRYQTMAASFDTWLTKDEYRKVLACLHPDTARGRTDAQLNEAFNLFSRLDAHVNRKVRQRAGGW